MTFRVAYWLLPENGRVNVNIEVDSKEDIWGQFLKGVKAHVENEKGYTMENVSSIEICELIEQQD